MRQINSDRIDNKYTSIIPYLCYFSNKEKEDAHLRPYAHPPSLLRNLLFFANNLSLNRDVFVPTYLLQNENYQDICRLLQDKVYLWGQISMAYITSHNRAIPDHAHIY